MTKYLVISADCHAGLPNPEYREWLDPEYREQFDAALVERARMAELAAQGFLNQEFADEWHADNEEGLRGGWVASDAARARILSSVRSLAGRIQKRFSRIPTNASSATASTGV